MIYVAWSCITGTEIVIMRLNSFDIVVTNVNREFTQTRRRRQRERHLKM